LLLLLLKFLLVIEVLLLLNSGDCRVHRSARVKKSLQTTEKPKEPIPQGMFPFSSSKPRFRRIPELWSGPATEVSISAVIGGSRVLLVAVAVTSGVIAVIVVGDDSKGVQDLLLQRRGPVSVAVSKKALSQVVLFSFTFSFYIACNARFP